jgi:hypothetical protein
MRICQQPDGIMLQIIKIQNFSLPLFLSISVTEALHQFRQAQKRYMAVQLLPERLMGRLRKRKKPRSQLLLEAATKIFDPALQQGIIAISN